MATLLLRRIVKKKHNIKGEAEGNKLLCAHSSGEFKDVTLNPFWFFAYRQHFTAAEAANSL